MSSLKEQIEIQKMYRQQEQAGMNDIEKRDAVIKDLQKKLQTATKKDIIVKSK